jgi:hypothetical protein
MMAREPLHHGGSSEGRVHLLGGSLEPEIAKKHFGFEFWLMIALFLFVGGMIIAQWLRCALVKPLVETPGAIYSPAGPRSRALD